MSARPAAHPPVRCRGQVLRAWPIVGALLAACGDGVPGPDAPLPPDAGGGLVSLRYRADPSIGAVSDVPVYFQNADSSLVLATRTNPDGEANAFMAPGGFVTLVTMRGNSHILYTHAGVQPGDELVVDARASSMAGRDTAIILRIPPDPGASIYQLFTGCGSRGVGGAEVQPLTIHLFDCEPLVDMLLLAFGNGLHYQYRKDVPLPPSSSVTFTDLYRSMVYSAVHVTNIPPAFERLAFTQALIGQRRGLYTVASTIASVAGEGITMIEMPVPLDGTTMTQLAAESVTATSVPHVIVWGPSSIATNVDYSAVRVPELVRGPRYEATGNVLRWEETDTGVVPDAVLATFQWSPPTTTENYQWRVLAPRTAAPMVRLPTLPRGDLVPSGAILISPFLPFLSLAIDGGYARVRGRLLGSWQPGSPWPIDQPAGRVDFQALNPNQVGPD